MISEYIVSARERERPQGKYEGVSQTLRLHGRAVRRWGGRAVRRGGRAVRRGGRAVRGG